MAGVSNILRLLLQPTTADIVARPFTATLLHTFAAGTYYGIGVTDGIVYIANYAGKVERFDLNTNTALTSFTVVSNTISAQVYNGELLVTRDAVSQPVSCYNPATGAFTRSFGSGSYLLNVVYDNGLYYIPHWGNGANLGSVFVYNGAGVLQRTVSFTGGNLHAIALKASGIISVARRDNTYHTHNYPANSTAQITPTAAALVPGWHCWSRTGELLVGDNTTSKGLRLFSANLQTQTGHLLPTETVHGVARQGEYMYAITKEGKLYLVDR